jgi:hypothetical protein
MVMPTKLPSGVVIYNCCPHPLSFWCGEEHGVIKVPSDGIINARPIVTVVKQKDGYALVTVTYTSTPSGESFLRIIRKSEPKALIVGSLIAAQAYPEEIVSPAPFRSSKSEDRLNRSDRFTVFLKEKVNV